MNSKVLVAVVTLVFTVNGQTPLGTPSQCKSPTVEQRRMADDVRYASPFYVIALPKTPKTMEIDNVCYTYFESENNTFHNIMSIVYKNRTNVHYRLSKSDIWDRNGLAEARDPDTSSCVYHDYTLVPICNVSVFILYRCFIEGDCRNADIGVTSGVDVRVVLAASTIISDACRQETDLNLKDTSSLDGGDYIFLPQRHQPQCVTRYGKQSSLNPENALGSTTLEEPNDNFLGVRIGGDEEDSLLTNLEVTEKEQISEKPLLSSLPKEGVQVFLNQHTPETTVPRRTYAEVVKTGRETYQKIELRPGMNIIPYNPNIKTKCCSNS